MPGELHRLHRRRPPACSRRPPGRRRGSRRWVLRRVEPRLGHLGPRPPCRPRCRCPGRAGPSWPRLPACRRTPGARASCEQAAEPLELVHRDVDSRSGGARRRGTSPWPAERTKRSRLSHRGSPDCARARARRGLRRSRRSRGEGPGARTGRHGRRRSPGRGAGGRLGEDLLAAWCPPYLVGGAGDGSPDRPVLPQK